MADENILGESQEYDIDLGAADDSDPFANSTPVPDDDNPIEDYDSPAPRGGSPVPIVILVLGLLTVIGGAALAYFYFFANEQNNNVEIPQDNQQEENEAIRLEWWGAFLSEATVQPIIDKYKESNPNVDINYVNQFPAGEFETGERNYRSSLNDVFSKQDVVELPDIFMVQNTWVGDYEISAASAPDDFTIDNIFYKSVTKDFGYRGLIYGTPLWVDNVAIVYNKEMLQEQNVAPFPNSWLELQTLAQSLTVKEDGEITRSGLAIGTSDNTTFNYEILNSLLVQNGVALEDETKEISFTPEQNAQEVLGFYREFGSSESSTWNNQFENESIEFLRGNTAMIIVPSWRLREILNAIDNFELEISVGVAPMPLATEDQEVAISWTNYWGNMVSKDRVNSDEAWKFLIWLTEEEQLTALSQAVEQEYGQFGSISPRIDMADSYSDDEYLRVYSSQMQDADTFYAVKGIEVEEEYKKLIDNDSNLSDFINEIDRLRGFAGIFDF